MPVPLKGGPGHARCGGGGGTARHKFQPEVWSNHADRRGRLDRVPATMGTMDEGAFIIVLTVAALVLALWLDVRFGDSRPKSPTQRILHSGVAYILLQASMAILRYVDDAGAASSGMAVTVLAVFLPALVYAFLTGIWLLRTVAEVARAPRT